MRGRLGESVLVVACAALVACGPRVAPREPGEGVPHTSARVVDALDFRIVDPRTNEQASVLYLASDGSLRSRERPLGRLKTDGSLELASTNGALVARLEGDGRITVRAAPGYAGPYPGTLTAEDFEKGVLRSGYAIATDGSAEIALGRTLDLDASGWLVRGGRTDHDFRVIGLTASSRRRAMFLYVLLGLITQPK